ncbi:serine-threonine protein kinase, plant-type, putative [Ricinus communis]|uniref:Serine-threonine protein kinase, plant-type, putative n=1 Tax=Ricinus communis TaxID=3988 RepID=B9RKX4_RICCO|nr:serine-threonine protein kinase, plant-type, putative [Ricinus communis]
MGLIRNGIYVVLIIIILNHLGFIAAASLKQKKINFTYESFPMHNLNFLKFEGNSTIYNQALQLTPETLNKAFLQTHYNKSGRITYPHPFRLWSSSGGDQNSILASFNTSFLINIYREPEWDAGHGLAFIIAPNYSTPDASFGQWLGLTNSSTDGSPDNHILAIEFDTQKQDGIDEIDGDHVGFNTNSVRSKQSVSLDKHNITLSPPPPGANYSVWIDYNGAAKILEVYIVNEGNAKPQEPILRESINLKDYLKQESYFGFAASTGDPEIELNCVLKWRLEIDDIPKEESDDKLGMKIGVGLGVSGGTILAILAVCACVYHARKRRSSESESGSGAGVVEDLKRLPGMPREFKYKELKNATNKFDESMKLGEGGFGIVYKGVLYDKNHTSATEIAVKKFSRDNIKGKDDFLAELTIIHRLRHKNLVRLVGWCYEKGKLLLVYDFMPNGSLEKHLYEAPQQDKLNWSRRCKVLTGVASALHYLHAEYDQTVIHRDLKASNILLDKDFNARLGDFGLARALENEKNSYAELGLGGVPGTIGYVAPECFHTATRESDVFGFGAVVLEVVCGKGPGMKIHHNQHLYSLVDWVWMLHREGRILEAVDERLENDYVKDEANRLLILGLACSHPIDSERPKAQAIVQILSGALAAPHVPPFKPVFMWPSLANMGDTHSSLSLSGISLSSQNSGGRIQSDSKIQRISSNLPV